jgi:cellulose synthase/poly-beta-1,6-N-acetylglucosamine synthase-like glycosyltransferase
MSQLLILFISVILYGVVLILFIPITFFFLECTLALLPESKKLEKQLIRPSITVLIPAHNENQVIGKTLAALLPQLTEKDQIVVIADNCTDNTAELAHQFGATVIERNDQTCKGKGYALAYGLKCIENPSQVLVIIDADCIVQPDFLNQISLEVMRTMRPIQAVYVMEQTGQLNPKNLVSVLAFKIKNLVRPQGLAKLALPCLLTGSGMAFPWSVIRHAPLASGNIVEDMQLGIDLAIAGHPPLFFSQVQVTGLLPQQEEAAKSQKTRWIHGHLQTLKTQVPKLIKAAITQRRFELLAIALELCVPPLSLLVITCLITLLGSLLLGFWQHEWTLTILSLIEQLLIFVAVIGAWGKFARNNISLKNLLSVPFYLLWKIPIYLAFLFKPQQVWVRTERDTNVTQLPNLAQLTNLVLPTTFSLSSKIFAVKEQVRSELANEAETILFHTQSGSYYILNEVATFIWTLIQEPQTITYLCDTILSEYAVTPEVCLNDLLAILEQLATRELIEISNEVTA